MTKTVSVIGEGMIAAIVSKTLSDRFEVVCQSELALNVPESAELIIVVYDEERSSDYIDAGEVLGRTGIPWLRGFTCRDEGFVGPLVRPGIPGCSLCADNRRLLAGHRPEESPDLPHGGRFAPAASRGSGASIPGLRHMAHMLTAEAESVLQGSESRLQEHMYIMDLTTLASSRHFILPDPLCPECGSLPDDSSQDARIALQPRPKANRAGYRSRPLASMKTAVEPYFDSRTGLMNDKMHDLVSPFASVTINLPSFAYGNEVTAGRSHSYAESELTAMLEGLERHCGQAPSGKRTVVRESFHQIAHVALDPVHTGLYSKEQYELPDFPFQPYDPDTEIDWIWGYSFLRERPILVPETLAYYSSGFGGGFVQEGSNGCAIGGSLEEAILYGILEVAERDAFLMTWYARLPLPRLDLHSAGDLELLLMVERLRAAAGYDVHLFNMTMENGIPGIWALAKNVGTPGRMNLICAAGAHPDPVRAAKSAIHELAGMLPVLQEMFGNTREGIESMYDDPSLVRNMPDHALLYGLPQAEERLRFLLDTNRPLQKFHEALGMRAAAAHADLTDDLKDLLHRFRQLRLDVIVVDQSSPEIARNGLHCVKVLIPGMLPMTFGSHLARLTGLERVHRVPMELGYADRPLTAEQLNPYPHPFI
ncbi:TOMM precursor leader peptide-binding protein [Paenibacillus mesophilus]|uniref:TOMM precursor leader peptide-binding protein n=1 Tax=Paenibacillus mesophilus TaxID=2582849 RepID=UPI00110E41BD|nr:TOMM precursor leader peptide-binding protein [Paenibacillus mesophilus]TMV43991.1 TOMM precursor leader peptide-binding protein [Paenibacillus mesophilus]